MKKNLDVRGYTIAGRRTPITRELLPDYNSRLVLNLYFIYTSNITLNFWSIFITYVLLSNCLTTNGKLYKIYITQFILYKILIIVKKKIDYPNEIYI